MIEPSLTKIAAAKAVGLAFPVSLLAFGVGGFLVWDKLGRANLSQHRSERKVKSPKSPSIQSPDRRSADGESNPVPHGMADPEPSAPDRTRLRWAGQAEPFGNSDLRTGLLYQIMEDNVRLRETLHPYVTTRNSEPVRPMEEQR